MKHANKWSSFNIIKQKKSEVTARTFIIRLKNYKLYSIISEATGKQEQGWKLVN